MHSETRHPGRRKSDKDEHCPRCHVGIESGHMDSHMYYAHGVDRRAKEEDKTPPPPPQTEKRKPAPKPQEEGTTKRKGSRWFARPE